MDEYNMKISEVINLNAVDFNMDAVDKEGVLDKICGMLYRDGSITSQDAFKKDVYLREQEGHTGIGGGIAIPHGKSEAVAKTCISVVRLKNPVPWETIDGQPVQVVILFAVDINDKNNYFVKLMSQVARRLARPGVCEQLLVCGDKQGLLSIFSE